MTSQQILQSDFLDILFEKRNKMYGAYSLRKNYSTELLKAMGITFFVVFACMFLIVPSENQTVTEKPVGEYKVSQVVLPPEEKPEMPKPKLQQPPVASQPVKMDVFNTQLRTVDRTHQTVATQIDLQTTAIGSSKIEGPSLSGLQPPQLPPVIQGMGGDVSVEKSEPPLANRQPQFPGGTAAWIQFLSKNLRAPQDMEPGEKRMCQIRFSVDEEGSITNFQVVVSGGIEFDNEVIRVLKKMPRWLPAIQNGKPAAVSFTQPVTFAAAEE